MWKSFSYKSLFKCKFVKITHLFFSRIFWSISLLFILRCLWFTYAALNTVIFYSKWFLWSLIVILWIKFFSTLCLAFSYIKSLYIKSFVLHIFPLNNPSGKTLIYHKENCSPFPLGSNQFSRKGAKNQIL